MLALIPIIGPALALIGTVIGFSMIVPIAPFPLGIVPGALILALSF